MSTGHLYTVYGITIASEFEFPELVAGSGAPDLRVRSGVVGEGLPESTRGGIFFETKRDSFLLCVEGIARFWACAGREVVIDTAPDASEQQVRTLFLGLVLTAILHQRGVLVLHASGVVGSHGAMLFAGHSGDGKSTLLAALASRGYEPFGDDAAVVTQESTGRLLAHPGFPQVRLRADVAARLGHSIDELCPVLPSVDKYALRLGAFRVRPPEALGSLYVLGVQDDDDELRFEPMVGGECFAAVRTYTRNLHMLEGLQMQLPHFHLAAAVASRIPVVRITRPRGRDSLDELVDRLEASLP